MNKDCVAARKSFWQSPWEIDLGADPREDELTMLKRRGQKQVNICQKYRCLEKTSEEGQGPSKTIESLKKKNCGTQKYPKCLLFISTFCIL
ncbi:hypothetical protein TNCV_3996821 [Trichonephila clavipes]|nr:hypothetical protein TNCV_3996821 [Trichonephila clavipes]